MEMDRLVLAMCLFLHLPQLVDDHVTRRRILPRFVATASGGREMRRVAADVSVVLDLADCSVRRVEIVSHGASEYAHTPVYFPSAPTRLRSEERRVGKECRSR